MFPKARVRPHLLDPARRIALVAAAVVIVSAVASPAAAREEISRKPFKRFFNASCQAASCDLDLMSFGKNTRFEVSNFTCRFHTASGTSEILMEIISNGPNDETKSINSYSMTERVSPTLTFFTIDRQTKLLFGPREHSTLSLYGDNEITSALCTFTGELVKFQ